METTLHDSSERIVMNRNMIKGTCVRAIRQNTQGYTKILREIAIDKILPFFMYYS